MSTNLVVGKIGGLIRLRTGLAGYNLKDPDVDPRGLTSDSAWQNAFRLLKSGVVAGGSLATQIINYPIPAGAGGNRQVRRIPVAGATNKTPALAWAVAGSGTLGWAPAGRALSLPDISTPYQKAYRTCAVNIAADEIKVSPSYSALSYAYLVFKTDATAAEGGGANGARFGHHPLYGVGANISRPGFNHRTCSLDDMMLTTGRNVVQVYETGTAVNNRWTFGGAFNPGDNISGSPFSEGAAVNYAARVTLSGSYPDYPPVVAYRMDTGYSSRLPAIYWLSPNEIIISGLRTGDSVRYAVLAVDPAYEPAPDTVRVRRILFRNGELDISKHDVDCATATEAQFLYRSRRLAPRFNGFEAFPTAFPTGVYSLPTAAPVGASAPFVFFLSFELYGGWWCGCGYSDMQDIVGASGVYNSWWRAAVINRSQYRWFKEPSITPSFQGWTTTMNVSDF